MHIYLRISAPTINIDYAYLKPELRITVGESGHFKLFRVFFKSIFEFFLDVEKSIYLY